MRYRFFLEPTFFMFFWISLSGALAARSSKAAA
jgi:hypothetical protein